MKDVIIVGARCAGSPLGMLLARKGYDVLVVDRATFPSDTLSTHALTPDGVMRLDAWGLLDRLFEAGCKSATSGIQMIGQTRMPQADLGRYSMICPRRTVIDKILVDAAREAGAEVREGFSVEGLVFDGDRVTGIRGHGRDGVSVEETARIVVGADGRYSQFARWVNAEAYNVHAHDTCGYYSYWSGVETESLEMYVGGGRAVFAFKTNDGLTCMAAEFLKDEFERVRNDPEAAMLEAFDTIPGFGERVRAGTRAEPIRGSSGLETGYRKPFGPGWALAGDAGYYKDPLLGQGMNDAFRDADLLSEAIDAGFAGRQPLEEALAAFETRRNAETAMMFQITNILCANLDPSPEIAQMMSGGPPRPAATESQPA